MGRGNSSGEFRAVKKNFCEDGFHDEIKSLIERWAYPMYIVVRERPYVCGCGQGTPGQGNGGCGKCLGTGYRIWIKRFRGIWQPSNADLRFGGAAQQLSFGTCYFAAQNFVPSEGDILVRMSGEAEILQRVTKYRLDSDRVVYYECETAAKKNHVKNFLAHFKQIVGEDFHGV